MPQRSKVSDSFIVLQCSPKDPSSNGIWLHGWINPIPALVERETLQFHKTRIHFSSPNCSNTTSFVGSPSSFSSLHPISTSSSNKMHLSISLFAQFPHFMCKVFGFHVSLVMNYTEKSYRSLSPSRPTCGSRIRLNSLFSMAGASYSAFDIGSNFASSSSNPIHFTNNRR